MACDETVKSVTQCRASRTFASKTDPSLCKVFPVVASTIQNHRCKKRIFTFFHFCHVFYVVNVSFFANAFYFALFFFCFLSNTCRPARQSIVTVVCVMACN